MNFDKPQTKIIQTKVVLGVGSEEFFKEVDFYFPRGKELYLIEKVSKWIDVYDTKVVGGNKVIFNAWIYKNIAYKTAECLYTDKDGDVTVTGDIVHVTKRVPLAGCIKIKPECGAKIKEKDFAEVLEAEVVGEVEELLCPKKLRDKPPYPFMEDKEDECKKDEDKKDYKPCRELKPIKCDGEPVYVYRSLHEKMCIKIKVKVVGWEHIPIKVTGYVGDAE